MFSSAAGDLGNGRLRALHAALLGGAATVVRQRGDVFDRLDGHAGGLQGGDGAFATAARAFDADVQFADAELRGFFGTLLGRHLAGEGRALAAPLEAAGAGTGPAQRVAFG